ncbi:MAG: FG-GAP-like repeat-containing protein, partial [Saprospiraceae bacterium]
MIRITTLILFSLFFTTILTAQWAREDIVLASASDGRELKPYDMDGDGDMDIIEVNSDAFGWYENTDGANNYIFHVIGFDDSFGNSSIEAGDFDGDGDLDIVVGKNSLVWYR